MVKTVAVIGAGAAGLCALKHLSARPADYTVVCFERYYHLGGTWAYTDRVGTDIDGLPVHASMYKNLRTNFPKDVLMFPDFPFSEPLPSFPSHSEVLNYLEQYADHFSLKQYIKFGTMVKSIEPTTPGQADTKWNLVYSSVADMQTTLNLVFDAVLVCNGHYSSPFIPDFPGTDQFLGSIVHTHNYRTPDQYKGQTVVICGAGKSGQDISTDVASVANTVYFSHRTSDNNLFLADKNVFHKPNIQRLTPKSVIFSDGQEHCVDSIIYCTGYQYKFPFLGEKCEITLQDEGRRITPLYKHMIHTKYPSLVFIGLLQDVPAFSLFEVQMRYVVKVFEGSVHLPSRETMNRETEEELMAHTTSGLPGRRFHYLTKDTFSYFDDLDNLTGSKRVPLGRRQLFYEAVNSRRRDFTTYSNISYEVTVDSFKILQ